ncbi:MAG: hypothetical protein H0T91_09180 [Propionibacteriaceae bacterium]|nr:hypothetical protein [Propionibacteriaceae bacterium]
MLSDATLSYGEDLAPALLGLDALYADEQGKGEHGAGGDIERLVVLNMSTTHRPLELPSYAAARERFAELRATCASLPEPDRRLYYAQVCDSAISFATWRESGLPFPDQIAGFLHVPANAATGEELDGLKAAMRPILADLGYSGDLASQFTAWEDRLRIQPEDVRAVLDDLLSAAWDRTVDVLEIPSERSDGMRVETVSGVPYNAMCDYSRRLIRLNIEPILTLPGLRHLAVHEGYPGHYVQFKRREVGYAAGISPADVLLSVVNTASSTTFEGIADVGLDVIGWQSDLDDRVGALLARYRSGIGTRAAWRLHAEGWSPERVREELIRDALVGGEGWVDARMRFISRHDRAALIWSYWHGEPSVSKVWSQVRDHSERRKAYFAYAYDRMHSPQSLTFFPG